MIIPKTLLLQGTDVQILTEFSADPVHDSRFAHEQKNPEKNPAVVKVRTENH